MDCCYGSTASLGGRKELLAASSWSERANEGKYSFSQNFIRTLNGLKRAPTAVALLHGKMVSDRKRVKGEQMPVHCQMSDSTNRGSIILEPLKPPTPHLKARTQESQLFQLEEPRVLIKISLKQEAGVPDVKKWYDWLSSNMPPYMSRADISVEGLFESGSTMLLIGVPVAVWATLTADPAYEFVSFVYGRNRLLEGRRAATSSEESMPTSLESQEGQPGYGA